MSESGRNPRYVLLPEKDSIISGFCLLIPIYLFYNIVNAVTIRSFGLKEII